MKDSEICRLTVFSAGDIKEITQSEKMKVFRCEKEFMVMMKQRKIKISSIAAAKDFVSKATECDFDINIFYNRVIIDAKSILGVLSLDLTRVLTVEYDGENAELEKFIEENDASKIDAVA